MRDAGGVEQSQVGSCRLRSPVWILMQIEHFHAVRVEAHLQNEHGQDVEEQTRFHLQYHHVFNVYQEGLVAQWITRLTTDQEIPGSNPGKLVSFFLPCL